MRQEIKINMQSGRTRRRRVQIPVANRVRPHTAHDRNMRIAVEIV